MNEAASPDQAPAASRPDPERPRDAVLSAALLADEVLACGLPVQWLHRACFTTEVDGRSVGFWCARTNLVSAVAEHLTTRKDLTARVLESHGIPTITTWAYPAEDLDTASRLHGAAGPLVIKPARGSRGRGVSVGVRSAEDLRVAWAAAAAIDPGWVLVQPQAHGHELRLLVVEARVVAAAHKKPPTIVGDGQRDIRDLIIAINERRAANRHLAGHPLVLDERRTQRLRYAGVGPSTVLAPGRRVVVDDKAALSDGGTSHDVTDRVAASHLELAVRTAECFPGLSIAGVDLLVQDIATTSAAVVLEVNSMPGLGTHHYPYEGRARPVAREVVAATLAAAKRTDSLTD